MEPIGTFLRREREDRGLSLDEIADVTRIPSTSLSLLEVGGLVIFHASATAPCRSASHLPAQAMGI